jgi:hypothetical protein
MRSPPSQHCWHQYEVQLRRASEVKLPNERAVALAAAAKWRQDARRMEMLEAHERASADQIVQRGNRQATADGVVS